MVRPIIKNCRFLLVFGAILALGTFLRLYMLSEQILLDDEWHGIASVVDKTFLDILTTFNPTLNSSTPLNLYRLFLLRSFGWSELALRLPDVLAGLLGLILFPLLLKKIFNERMALAFALLLAISPFMIFYCRFARSYSIMMLLCFWALLLFHQWLVTGKNRHIIGFVITGSLAIYTHPLSIITIFALLVVAIGIALFNHFIKSSSAHLSIVPSLKKLIIASFIMAVLVSLLLLPVLLQSSKLPWAAGRLTLSSFIIAATLVSGTANTQLTIIFLALCPHSGTWPWLDRCSPCSISAVYPLRRRYPLSRSPMKKACPEPTLPLQ